MNSGRTNIQGQYKCYIMQPAADCWHRLQAVCFCRSRKQNQLQQLPQILQIVTIAIGSSSRPPKATKAVEMKAGEAEGKEGNGMLIKF